MKYQYLFKIIFIIITIHYSLFTIHYSFAQISEGGLPLSFYKTGLINNFNTVILAEVNHRQMLKEDSVEAIGKTVPLRFGKDIDVNLNPENSGTWQKLQNGDKIWRLGIHSKGAYSINFIFNKFRLPEGTKLFIYNADMTSVIGAFTEKNNRDDGIFATTIIKGDKAIIEYYQPVNISEKPVIQLSKVIHAYRDLWKQAKDYGGSGSCNINVNCPEGLPWYNEKRAVAMILQSNNTRICSGSLVNNVRQDGTPYFLTANHCTQGDNVSTWIFMFNYESPGCTSQNGPTNQTIQGATLVAQDTPSDFSLLKLSNSPPINYNVYFAGWNAINIPADSCTVIHHPSGDIKKVSLETATLVSSDWSTGTPDSHWDLPFYTKGTTEQGSSGAPLFDKYHHIKGQLHGGTASCSSQTDDYYGKFSYSWNIGTTPITRLKDWLDPDNTGTTILNGKDFNHALYNLDAAISGIISPDTGKICSNTINPEITLKNYGSHTLRKADIYYRIDNKSYSKYSWTGSIKYLYTATVKFNQLNISEGNHVFTVYVSSPNDSADYNHSNDTAKVSFDYVIGGHLNITLKTDYYANETSWKIKDSQDNILYINPVLVSNTLTNTAVCLSNGCYTFTIYDSMGDGMCISPANDSAYFTISNDFFIIKHLNGCKFDTAYSVNFCITGINEHNQGNRGLLSLYPNPASDELNINFISASHQSAEGFIYSIDGRLLKPFYVYDNRITSIKIPELHSGMYLLKVKNNDLSITKKFFVLR